MIPQTIPLNEAPASLGSWDRIVKLSREQNAANQEQEASLEQKREWIKSDLTKLLAKEGLEAPVFFLPRSKPVRADKAVEFLDEASEYDNLKRRLIQLCWHASNGMDCKALADALMEAMVERVALNYAEELA